MLLGLCRRPDHAAVADAAAAHLPQGEGDPGDRPLGDDDADRPGRRPDPRRHHLRQLSAGNGSSSSRCRSPPPAGSSLLMLLRGQAGSDQCPAFIDKVGLALLVIWVGALQIMLDEGRNHDWFSSHEIRMLGGRRRDRLRRLPDLGADREEPDRRSADLPPPRLRRRRDDLLGGLRRLLRQHRDPAALAAVQHGLHRDLGRLRDRHHGHPRGARARRSSARRWKKFDPRLIVSLGILGLGRDHAVADVDVQHRRHLPADGLADARSPASFMVMFFVPVTGPRHGQRRSRRAGERRRHLQLHADAGRRLRDLAHPEPAGRTRRARNNTEIAERRCSTARRRSTR